VRSIRFLRLFSALLLSSTAVGVGAGITSVVTVTASVEPAAAPPGSTVRALFAAHIEEPWHIYGINALGGPVATSLSVEAPEGIQWSAAWIEEPEPEIIFDPGFQVNLPIHHHTAVFTVPLAIGEDVPAGEHTVDITMLYQACEDTTCLRPTRVTGTVTVVVDPNAAAVESAIMPRAPPAHLPDSPAAALPPALGADGRDVQIRIQSALDAGFGSFILTAVILGFAALLTPCVFPMIPITIAVFTKRGEAGRGSAFGAALVYATTIVATFSLLGLFLAATWGASGARNLAANPWMNLALGALFVALALSLFGLFELRLPRFLTNWATRGERRGGVLGIVFMGLAFTFTSFTCTVAFVGFLLGQAAQGEWLWPALGMVAFSAAFASPFFLLALFPQFLARLPTAGGWLHSTKVVMGLLELAAALKFLSNADLVWDWGFLRNGFVLTAWASIALVMTVYLFGLFRLPLESGSKPISVGRMMLGLGSTMLTISLFAGLLGGPLPVWVATYLPEIQGERLEWIEDLDEGYEVARATGRPIFVDFSGYTCTNCRQMEVEIFPMPEVESLLAEYVRVRLMTDDRETGERWSRIQEERFATAALPFYVLLTPNDEVIDTRAGMIRPASDFAEFLRDGLSAAAAGG
jgi:thiol:disulfide interchange protein DsbD